MYRAPSMKTLQALHRLDDEQRHTIRCLIRGKEQPRNYPSVMDWIRRCYHEPLWKVQVIWAIDDILGTHGVETVYHKGELKAEYCNTGNTYAPTIIYRYDTDTFSVGSWGDLVERHHWNGEQ